jgi:hypothetical protein
MSPSQQDRASTTIEHHDHSHPHDHDHAGHEHPHILTSREEPYVDTGPTSGPSESLVLDIGGDVGALILHADESTLGSEIDITPVGTPQSHAMHTMIRRRRAVDREVIVGVYPELTEGNYVLWGLDGEPLGEVAISGGRVSELHGGNCRGAS